MIRLFSATALLWLALVVVVVRVAESSSSYRSMSRAEVMHNLHEKLTVLPRKEHSDEEVLTHVQSLITRVLRRGEVPWAESFRPVLQLIDYESVDGQLRDVFEIDANPTTQQLVLRGSSGVALSSAFGHYLRQYLHCDFHWERAGNYSFATTLLLSENDWPLPSTTERTVFLSKYRYYQNTCTASYSFVWKDWAAWEQEIDWMAMNGFNLPLAFTGQEIVWKALWTKYGLSAEGLSHYFTGPAFMAWQRMANIRGFAGPLSDHWINAQADLQRQILRRYHELGITPVLPAFSGLVPEEIMTLYPTANISQLTPAWNQFPQQYCCNFMLSSTDPLFQQIGKDFLLLQRDIFGTLATQTHIYNVDTFNENTPFSADADYLYSASHAVYEYMHAVDEQAIWLMQGWLFLHDPFWTTETIADYLAGVPDDAMIVLDLAAEDLPMWPKIVANNKAFIWCMLHNYGGRRALYGNLTLLATDPLSVQTEAKELFLGTGLTMEAIEQNPIVYEFMSDMAMSRTSPEVLPWTLDYAARRYNLFAIADESSRQMIRSLSDVAWTGLLANNYQGETPICHHYCHRESIVTQKPSFSLSQTKNSNAGKLVDIWASFIHLRESIGNQSLVHQEIDTHALDYDLIDVGRQVLVNLFYDYFALMNAAYQRKDTINFSSITKDMLLLINDLEALLSSHKSYLLGTWIANARQWASDDVEADLFDYNARNQITLWGDNGEIDDYAMKQWGGLMGQYYLKRWELFFHFALTALSHNQAFDSSTYQSQELQWGQTFCHDAENVFPVESNGDSLAISQTLSDHWGIHYKATHGYAPFVNTTIVGSNLVSGAMWTLNVKQLERLCDSDANCVGFTSDGYLKLNDGGRSSQPGVTLFIKNKCLSGQRC